uniref:Ribonuclease H-like domain-containing protein n=1 Tax=Tanacetum cinerariifolium TaxID=118510 RepID=A0A699I2M8_TANCI|nr:ribonuclease H-like domain-containing protein [Tanacetum cinerariifolium]
MLLMALPNEHLMTFSQYKDAKSLFAAIGTRFGGNEATKKTQKTHLKQMYENFSAPSTKSLDSIFNRLQKIISQLTVLGEFISQEDLNLKFLRSLSFKWNTHVVFWRNKPDLDTMSIDDFYNNFKIVKQEVKETASLNSSSQNMAFVSFPSTNNTNEVHTAYGVSTANTQSSTASTQVSTASTQTSIANLSDATIYAFLANQSNGGKKITINGSDTVDFDKSKMECYNCHKMGHFARECRGPRNQDSRNMYQDSSRRTVHVEETPSKAMVAIDGFGFDWSYMCLEVQTLMILQISDDAGSPTSGDAGKKHDEMPGLETIETYDDYEEEADFNNLESSIHVSPTPTTIIYKNHPLKQGCTQEEGIDYDDVFALVARIECVKFERLMKDKFQMSSMGELTLFLGLQVKQKEDGIFISQDKYVAEVLRKFNFSDVKSASTPMDTEKTLVKDANGDDVDVHLYRSMIGSLMYLTTSRPDIMYAQYKKRIFWGTHTFVSKYLAIQAEEGKGLGHPSEPQPPPSTTQPTNEEPIPNDDRVERAATTAASLDAEQASGNINMTQSTSNDPPLSRGHTLGSREDSIKLVKKLMETCTNLSERVLALEESKTAQDLVITRLKLRVKKLVSAQGESHIQEYQPEDQLGVFSAAEVLADAARKNVQTYTKRRGVSTGSGGISSVSRLFSNAEESVSTGGASMPVSIAGMVQEVNINIPSPVVVNDKGKGKMKKNYFAAQKAEAKRNKPMTQAQQRAYMSNYIKNIGSYTLNQLRKLSFDEIKKLFETTMKRVNTFVPIETKVKGRASELAAGSSQETITNSVEVKSSKRDAKAEHNYKGSKRKKTNEASRSVREQPNEEENELSQEDLQQMMMVVPVEEVYVEALQVKYPSIDWEVYTEEYRKDDLVMLWSLVKERFSSTKPTDDKERTLWVKLKRLFKPDTDDTLWKL